MDGARLERITDTADPRVAAYFALRERETRSRSDARTRGQFLVEGRPNVERLLASRFALASILLDESRADELLPLLARVPSSVPCYATSRELHARVTGVHFHQGLIALAHEDEPLTLDEILDRATRIVVLEAIADHDNVGAVFRNVAALAGENGAVLLDPRCADPLYRKSIRTSMGWALHVPFARLQRWPDDLHELRARGWRVLGLTPVANAVSIDAIAQDAVDHRTRIAWLVGAEGSGLSWTALAACDARVRIPIATHVDSLNLATACAIALHRCAPNSPVARASIERA